MLEWLRNHVAGKTSFITATSRAQLMISVLKNHRLAATRLLIMASWASVARTEGVAGVAETGLEVKDGERVAVVDANAIISGLHLEGLAQKYVTIPEVIAEIRDKQARQFLSMLPYALHTLEPTEESTKFGE